MASAENEKGMSIFLDVSISELASTIHEFLFVCHVTCYDVCFVFV